MSTRGLGNRLATWFAALAAIALLLPLAGCLPTPRPASSTTPSATASKGPILVVASVNQWGTLAQEIGGDDVKVTTILNSTNVDAHDFEPKTSDIAEIQQAQVVVTNGAGYDSWASKSIAKGTVSVSAASTVGAISGDNPHLWFSKDARKAMATELADTFSKILPSKKKSFDKRLKTWQSEESDLEDAMAAFAKKHKNTTYAATEAVAYYLMSDMKLKDVTPQGYLQSVTSGGEAAPADLQEFQELLESDKAKLLVDNPQESSDSAALLKKTATANKVPVIEITEQMPSDQHTLTGWISSLVETMTKQVAAAQTDEKDSSNDTSDGTATDANTQDASPSPSSASQSASDPSSSASPSSAQ
ncbi:MAG: zinc ABC transporter substrate-binding protein [Bifidobacterium thermacidophilum]|jgi:zinc/manganese transport system substrate-binding protein|uniref:metal ABC transporter solute-binding protein, Zn/Mn family n=1 Tax=Bifidobacterium thermacidophilum TaxID=246618 RepID=UPI002F357F50